MACVMHKRRKILTKRTSRLRAAFSWRRLIRLSKNWHWLCNSEKMKCRSRFKKMKSWWIDIASLKMSFSWAWNKRRQWKSYTRKRLQMLMKGSNWHRTRLWTNSNKWKKFSHKTATYKDQERRSITRGWTSRLALCRTKIISYLIWQQLSRQIVATKAVWTPLSVQVTKISISTIVQNW